MKTKKKKALIVSGVSWNETWQRHQTNASILAEFGYEVDYINGVKTSALTFKNIISKIKSKFGFRNKKTCIVNNKLDNNIKLIPSYFIPPTGKLSKLINCKIYNLLYKNKLLSNNYDLVIYYVPIDSYKEINKISHYRIYDCVRAFKLWGGYHNSLYDNEHAICESADEIMCDSYYIKEKYLSNYNVKQLIPYNEYKDNKVKRTNSSIIKRICYFGSVSNHIDVELLNLLSEKYQVNIWGKIDSKIDMSGNIKYHGYISDQSELFEDIKRNSDMILIPYKGNMDGVFPAKLIASFALNIPVFTSEYYDSIRMSDLLYVYTDKDDLLKKIDGFKYDDFIINDNKRESILLESSKYIENLKLILSNKCNDRG